MVPYKTERCLVSFETLLKYFFALFSEGIFRLGSQRQTQRALSPGCGKTKQKKDDVLAERPDDEAKWTEINFKGVVGLQAEVTLRNPRWLAGNYFKITKIFFDKEKKTLNSFRQQLTSIQYFGVLYKKISGPAIIESDLNLQ